MDRKSLYVTVTPDCEDLANSIFPRGSEWEITDEDYDGENGIVRYEWSGDAQPVIEQNLNSNPAVISYQIL